MIGDDVLPGLPIGLALDAVERLMGGGIRPANGEEDKDDGGEGEVAEDGEAPEGGPFLTRLPLLMGGLLVEGAGLAVGGGRVGVVKFPEPGRELGREPGREEGPLLLPPVEDGGVAEEVESGRTGRVPAGLVTDKEGGEISVSFGCGGLEDEVAVRLAFSAFASRCS